MESAESNAPNVPIKLKTFVELNMDVASASPRRYFFEARILYVFCSSSKLYQPTAPRTCYLIFHLCAVFVLRHCAYDSYIFHVALQIYLLEN